MIFVQNKFSPSLQSSSKNTQKGYLHIKEKKVMQNNVKQTNINKNIHCFVLY